MRSSHLLHRSLLIEEPIEFHTVNPSLDVDGKVNAIRKDQRELALPVDQMRVGRRQHKTVKRRRALTVYTDDLSFDDVIRGREEALDE
jgi:hypothetical protein